MNVICPSCSTVYRVDPAKVPERGVRARCRICAAIFQVPVPAAQRTSAAEAIQPAEVAPTPQAVPAAAEDPWAHRSSEQAIPSAPVGTRQMATPVAEPPAPPPPPAEAPAPEPAAQPRTTAPRGVTTRAPRPSVAIPPVISPAARSSGPDLGRPHAAVPPAGSRPAPATPPAAAAAAAPPAGAKRMVNPFMSQDPQAKAKRLARALISDLVVYYPDRRQEGLRKGNLKEVFGEEIKKSWEEYRDQVGKEVAESTSYFNDALNDILAGGQKLW